MTESEKREAEAEAAKIAPILRDMLERINTPMHLDLMNALAIDRMAKYKAHIRAGFSPEQSLELCKS